MIFSQAVKHSNSGGNVSILRDDNIDRCEKSSHEYVSNSEGLPR
jgi:hypothetical protein